MLIEINQTQKDKSRVIPFFKISFFFGCVYRVLYSPQSDTCYGGLGSGQCPYMYRTE